MHITFEAYWELLSLEYPLRRRDFATIYDRVRRTPVRSRPPSRLESAQICRAVDVASGFYFHKVVCLQRSAATVRLLRRHGFAAQLVIGVQQLPFAGHAWVELDQTVINDKSYISDIYSVLERC
jgi:Transglutaminase-like superfamily